MNYHQKDPGKLKIRYAISIENNMLDKIEEVSEQLDLPRSKVTRALLRYGLEHITTKEIYKLERE